jgi:signal transduction histidine kinase
MRLRPASVRARTTLAATLVVVATLIAASVLLVRTLDHSLTSSADDESRLRLTELLAQARTGRLPAAPRGPGDDSLVQVVDASGRVVAASQNITGRPAIATLAEAGSRPRARRMNDLPDDQETEDYRVWSARTRASDGPVAIFVGQSLEPVGQVTRRLVRSLAIGLPPLVALLTLAIWVTVGRALRPVEGVRREVAAFGTRSRDRRVAVPETGDEIARLAATMNEMLGRLDEADRRQREFVANASHDLKSPLTTLRSETEVALTGADLAGWRETGRRLLAETDRMEALVSDLLFLAHAEETGAETRRALDLETVVAEEVARVPRDGPIAIEVEAGGAPVRGNGQELARMVRNLLGNALAFARGTVWVRVGEVDGQVTLVVEDDGPGIGEEHREEVFGRFVTLDSARRTAGTGLGLAIARTVAESHGGTLTLEGPAPTSRFVVRLPLLD